MDFQLIKISLCAMRLLNAIAFFCAFVVCISMGVTPKIAVSRLGLRAALHKTDRQSNMEDQKVEEEEGTGPKHMT